MKDMREAAFENYEAKAERAVAAENIVRAQNIGDRCRALLDFYRQAKADIVDGGIDPYEVRWTEVFTPIEAAMWHELRMAGLVFYPQLPVGRSFVDFGDPAHKVAIECDGKEFHLDKAKDRERDAALGERGWIVFRITGADCMAEGDELDDETWPTPIQAFVRKVAQHIKEAA